LKTLGENNNYSEEKPTHNGLRTPRRNELKSRVIHADDDDRGERVYDKENHCDGDISLLQKRIVLFAPPRASLDSDMALSDDDDFVINSFPNKVVAPPDMSLKSTKFPGATRNAYSSPTKGDVHTDLNLDLEDEEEDLHVDYAWVLSNRILYYQTTQQHTSKWVREKKGKRITEQDYENILQVLRTL
jgi:hypothetical protein